MPLNPGEMRHQVRLEVRSSTQDAAGEPVHTWSLFAERRASFEQMPGRELWGSEQRLGRAPTIFRVRYIPGVVPSMRLIWLGRLFDVVSVTDPDGLRVEQVLTCLEQVEQSP